MKTSKLSDILKTFSRSEIREFEKLLSSPYFGCKKFVLEYFRVLKKYHPGFYPDNVSREKLFHEVYGNRKFNDGLIRRMNSDILKFAEEYLMLKRLYKTTAYRNNCLLMELRDRNLQNSFRQKSSAILKELSKKTEIEYYYLYEKYLTQVEILNDRTQNNAGETFGIMEQTLRTMVLFFLNAFMSMSFNHKRQNRPHTDPIIASFLNTFDPAKFIAGIQSDNSNEANLIRTIYFANMITIDESDEYYQKMKKSFFGNYEMFSPQQKMIFYMRLSYFYQKQNNINNTDYLEDQMMCYRNVLNERLFLVFFPYMGVSVWRLYVHVCKLSGQYELISDYVRDYSEYFEPEYKKDFSNYCLAFYCICKKDYGRSLEYNSGVNIDLPSFRLYQKIMKLQCFLGLDFIESFYSEIDALKHYLRNNKVLSPVLKQSSNNFLSYLLKAVKKPSDKKTLKDIRVKLEKEQVVLEKNWLLSLFS